MPSLTCPGLPCPAQGTDDDSPTDWASILFFAGAVLGILNWATMSILREATAAQYFGGVLPAGDKDRGQVIACVGGIGMTMGSLVLLILAIFENGAPTNTMMYSAVRCQTQRPLRGWAVLTPAARKCAQAFMHLMFFIEQAVGLAKGNLDKVGMDKGPMIFWAVVNFIWTAASLWAANSERVEYGAGETVFGWDWGLLFKITAGVMVGANAIKSVMLDPTPPAPVPADDSADSESQALKGTQ